MEVTAKLRYLRIAPRKVREVTDLIRGRKVDEAQTFLEFLVRKSAKPVLKLLKAVTASARHDFQLEQSNLYISKILVDEGPKLKRWRPVSRGRTAPIMKRTSHITIVLDEIERTKRKKVSAKKPKTERRAEKPSLVKASEDKEKRITEKPKFKPAAKDARSDSETRREPRQRWGKEVKKHKKEIGLKRIFKRKAF